MPLPMVSCLLSLHFYPVRGSDMHVAAGSIKEPERMITARISLEEGVEKGFHALINEREKHVKILIGVDDHA